MHYSLFGPGMEVNRNRRSGGGTRKICLRCPSVNAIERLAAVRQTPGRKAGLSTSIAAVSIQIGGARRGTEGASTELRDDVARLGVTSGEPVWKLSAADYQRQEVFREARPEIRQMLLDLPVGNDSNIHNNVPHSWALASRSAPECLKG